jgi:CDP-diacylglycerol---serine O-phosphatidyltransferase
MSRLQRMPRNTAAVLTFSRPVLVFLAFVCSLWLMFTRFPPAYILGLTFLLLAMVFDWVDGWFAERYLPNLRLGALVDRMMDRIVLSIIFPVLGAGMIWRYSRLDEASDPRLAKLHLLHALFVLGICVTVLLRDQFAHFMRSFAQAAGQEVDSNELTRLRTIVASPMAVLLYAYAFYQPTKGWEAFYRLVDWIDRVPLRGWFVVESIFLIINIASMTLYLRKYGALALDDICEDDERLRRHILAVVPNTLTLMNGFLGITAVVFTSYGRVREALFVLVGAAFFDRLDGMMARRLGLTDPPRVEGKSGYSTGAILDDVSDAISFAIAPAVMFYQLMTDLVDPGLPLAAIVATSLIYGLAGLTRLTYFTLDKHPIPGFFKGMPVPAAALMATASMEIVHQMYLAESPTAPLWAMVSMVTLVAAAVVMNLFFIRYLHIGRLFGRRPLLLWSSVVASIVLVFTPWFGLVLLVFTVAYLVSPIFTSHIDPTQAELEQRAVRTGPQP